MPRAGRSPARATVPAAVLLGPPPVASTTTWTPGAILPVGFYDSGTPNVGPRIPEASMTVVNGDHVPVAGQVYVGLKILGRIIPGPGSTGAEYVDCIAEGRAWGQGPTWVSGTPVNDAIFNSSYNGRGVTLTHCRLDASGNENVWTDGVRGNNFTMRYCEVWRTVDGFGGSSGAYYGPTVIENCRFGNAYYTAWWNTAAGAPYSTTTFPSSPGDRRCHNDGAQIQGWSGYTIRGCYLGGGRAPGITSQDKQNHRDYLLPADQPYIAAVDAAGDFANSGMMIQNNIGAAAAVGALIENNWLTGGDATINILGARKTGGTVGNTFGDTLVGVTIRNNRFIDQSTFGASNGFAIYRGADCQATITGNVWDSDGTAVPIVNYG